MGTVRDGVYYSKHKGDEIDNLLDKTVWQSNPNLLDNWYLVGGGSQQGGGQFPINQRDGYLVPPGTTYFTEGGPSEGVTTQYYKVKRFGDNDKAVFEINGVEKVTGWYAIRDGFAIPGYTGEGYGIDRWKTNPGIQTTVLIESDGVTVISDSNNSSELIQVLEPGSIVVGNVYTLSILVKELNGSCTATVWNGNTINLNIGMNTLTFEATSDTYKCILPIRTLSGSIKISAVKLELGDTQTLAHQENGVWVLNEIPNYQEQLARCQRYQWIPDKNFWVSSFLYGSQYQGHIFFPTTMRVTPSVSGTSTNGIFNIAAFRDGVSFDTGGSASIITNIMADANL